MTGLRTANQNEMSQPESVTGFNFVLIIDRSVARYSTQSERGQRVVRQRASDLQSVIALKLRQCGASLRAEHTIDLSAIIAVVRKALLDRGNGRVTTVIGVTVLVVVLFAAVVILIVAVSVRIIVVAVAISVDVVIVRIPVRPAPPRPKSNVEDHPRTIKPVATMSVPPVIRVMIPITMPVR